MEIKAPVLAETPVTQRSPCYSAVSSSLMNPFLFFFDICFAADGVVVFVVNLLSLCEPLPLWIFRKVKLKSAKTKRRDAAD